MSSNVWRIRGQTLALGRRPLVMGIVNVTPDSFSDGGRYLDPAQAVRHGLELAAQGADILDIGGESTRPGAEPVAVQEELRRVLPVIEQLAAQTPIPISVDTSKALVARRAVAAGAAIINDVTALAGDPDMPAAARETGAGVVLMHMQGTPRTMQQDPRYDEVVRDIHRFFEERLASLAVAGIGAELTVLDPGIGFGKRQEHNLELLARLREFRDLGRPLLLGFSRKGFISRILGRQGAVETGVAGTLGVLLYALRQGVMGIVRVHDVQAARDAMQVYLALEERGPDGGQG